MVRSVVGAASHRFQQTLLNTTTSIRPDTPAPVEVNLLHNNGEVATNYGTFAPGRETESSLETTVVTEAYSLLDPNSYTFSIRTDGESPKRGCNHDDDDGAKPSKILKTVSANANDDDIDDSLEDIPNMDHSDSIVPVGVLHPSIVGRTPSSIAAVDFTIAAIAGVICAASVWTASSSVRKRRCKEQPSIDAQAPSKAQPTSSVPSIEEKASQAVLSSVVAARIAETMPSSVPVANNELLGPQRECSLCHVRKPKNKFSKNQWKKKSTKKCTDCAADEFFKAKENSKKNSKTAPTPKYGQPIFYAKPQQQQPSPPPPPPSSGWRQPLYPMNGHQNYTSNHPSAPGERYGTIMSAGPFAQMAAKAPPGGTTLAESHTFVGRYGQPDGKKFSTG